MTHNELSAIIVDTALQVHRGLGPGLLESVYEVVMSHEFRRRGLLVATEVPVPVIWRDLRLELGFRMDLLVNNMIVVELKSVETIAAVHKKQLLTYLRLADKRLGLLINCNVNLLKDGITRVVNKLDEDSNADARSPLVQDE